MPKTALPQLFEALAPAALDGQVKVQARLVRQERRQGEYWVLTLMMAGLKTPWSRCEETQRRALGACLAFHPTEMGR